MASPASPPRKISAQQDTSDQGVRPRSSSLPKERRARILSLDGGGVRGLVTIQVLVRLEKEIKAIDEEQSIRTCFDLVCGTSIGGIIAMALIGTDLSVKQIAELFEELPAKVFTGWKWWKKVKVSIGTALFLNCNKYSARHLERFIDESFDPESAGRTLRDATNSENKDLCGFVTTSRINRRTPQIFLHRTYPGNTAGDKDVHQVAGSATDSDLGVTIRGALRATSAAPTYFPRISLTNDAKEDLGTFVDGGFLANNPIELAVAEAFEKWPTRGLSTVLSIGTGMPKNVDDGTGRSRNNISYALTAAEMATESQRAHARMSTQAKVIRLMAQREILSGLEIMDANRDGMISGEEFHRYLAKFGIHKSVGDIPASFARFAEQKVEAGPTSLRDLFETFKNEIDEYADFPEYFRVNAPISAMIKNKKGKLVKKELNFGDIALDTTNKRELQRMVEDTNAWLDTDEMTARLRRIAERLTHKHDDANDVIDTLSPRLSNAANAPLFSA